MNDTGENSFPENPARENPERDWHAAALQACQSTLSPVQCPLCDASAVSGQWHLLHMASRHAAMDLHCAACHAKESLEMVLPEQVMACHPMDRLPLLVESIKKEAELFAARIGQHATAMPAAIFTTHPLWAIARWSGVSYQWHPTSEAPPVMGLAFENFDVGLEIFREAKRLLNHVDQRDEIRISIIEDEVPRKKHPGQEHSAQEHRPGYSVHLGADPDALCLHATMEGFVVDPKIVPFLGQWNRHYPVLGTPAALPRFKQEFETHQEFLLAPAVPRPDGNLSMEPRLGIIKKVIHFRQLSDITSPEDPDAHALVLPQLITPPD